MKVLLTAALLIFIGNNLYCQEWKQYADSAYQYKLNKNIEKSILYYQQAIEELREDSSGTNTYAFISDSLGICLYQNKEYAKAETCFLEAKSIQEKLFGRENLGYALSCSGLGIIYRDKRQYAKSELLLLETTEIRRKLLGKDHLSTANACINLARLYFTSGQFPKAKQYLLEVKEIREKQLSHEHPDYTGVCNNLALVYYYLGENENAEALYLETRQIFEKLSGKINADYANACNGLGIVYINMKLYDKARQQLEEAKNIREKVFGREHPDYVQACNNLAGLYQEISLYEKAEPLLLEAREIQERIVGKDHPMYANCCTNLASLYQTLGRNDKAEPLFQEAKQINERILGKEHPDYANSCHALASVYIDLGQNEKALALLEDEKKIIEKALGKEHSAYLRCCNSIAQVYKNIGEFEKAESIYQQVRVISGGKNRTSGVGLAFLYQNKGQYEKAEELFLETKEMQEKVLGKEHPEYGMTCDNLANLYGKMGQYQKSLPLLLEARQIIEKKLGQNHPDFAISCNSLAMYYYNVGQYDKAEPLLLQAKQIYETTGGKEFYKYAYACHWLAYHYMATGQYKKAEPLYTEAMQIQERLFGKEHEQYIGTCTDLAYLYGQTGRYDEAKQLLLAAKPLQAKIFGNTHPDYGTICDRLAKIYWRTGEQREAEKQFIELFSVNASNLFSFFQFTNELEKSEFIKHKLGEDDYAFSFYFSQKIISAHPYDLSLFHRNLILSSTQALKKQMSSATDLSLQNKYNEWLSLKKQLASLYSRPVNDRKDDPATIETRADLLEKELTKLSFSFKREQQKQRIDWKDIQDNIKSDEAAVEFVEFNLYNYDRRTDSTIYLALIVRKDKPLPQLVTLFEKKELERLLAGTEKQISDIYTDRSRDKKNVYQLIWEPIEKYITGISKVYYAPAGLLHRISFAALSVNPGESLSDKVQLVQLNSTAAVIDLASSPVKSSDKILLYGAINYNSDPGLPQSEKIRNASNKAARSLPDDLTRNNIWQSLAGTEIEIDGIKKAAGSRYAITVLSGNKANEESIKLLEGNASPAVIHIATHGFFFPDPRTEHRNAIQESFLTSGKPFKLSDNPLFRSGLLFAGANYAWQGKSVEGSEDGILTAYEVANMYLPNTKLVVLSACETGLGDIKGSEGVYGLQRAFKMAGAQKLIMSLWKVPDTETAEFMQLLYRNMFDGQSINDAFYHTQSTMKNKYRNEPYKWAAWVLIN